MWFDEQGVPVLKQVHNKERREDPWASMTETEEYRDIEWDTYEDKYIPDERKVEVEQLYQQALAQRKGF